MVTFLNAQVGKGQWVMVLTADHAAMPNPKVSGGFQISTGAVAAGDRARVRHDGDATPIVDNWCSPDPVYLNEDESPQTTPRSTTSRASRRR